MRLFINEVLLIYQKETNMRKTRKGKKGVGLGEGREHARTHDKKLVWSMDHPYELSTL